MSGTSMDGIDVAGADLTFEGDTVVLRPLGHACVLYPAPLRGALAAALPPAATTLEAVCRLDTEIGQAFAEAAAGAMAPGTELLVSHGQTVFHWVESGAVHGTLQIGNPAWIAERTGLPVVSDLRSADVAAGGQGAPLVSLFDVLLLAPAPPVAQPTPASFAEPGPHSDLAASSAAALNLGGIANLTAVRPGQYPVAFDIGPANALLDAAMAGLTNGAEHYDAGGARAARGQGDPELLAVLLADPYYALPAPKTTGKEHFHAAYLDAALTAAGRHDLPGADLLATLTELTATTVAAACRDLGVARVIASGGGTANLTLMAALARHLGESTLFTIDELGIPSAAKEAYAFALLGFLTIHGLPGTIPSCTGARHPSVLGCLTPGACALGSPPPAPRSPLRLVIRTDSAGAARSGLGGEAGFNG